MNLNSSIVDHLVVMSGGRQLSTAVCVFFTVAHKCIAVAEYMYLRIHISQSIDGNLYSASLVSLLRGSCLELIPG